MLTKSLVLLALLACICAGSVVYAEDVSSPSRSRAIAIQEPTVRVGAAPDLRQVSDRMPAGFNEGGQGASVKFVSNAVVQEIEDKVAGDDLDRLVRCVAQAVYHEARGEPRRGQLAVADVVVNRARTGRWGDECGVVDAPYQFSGRKHWQDPVPGDPAWDRALEIAEQAMGEGGLVSRKIMNFRHARMGAPVSKPMRIGQHLFW